MSTNLPQQWFDRAREDLQVARLVLQEQHFAHTCFLAQQCIEKSLKAYLLAKANTYATRPQTGGFAGRVRGA